MNEKRSLKSSANTFVNSMHLPLIWLRLGTEMSSCFVTIENDCKSDNTKIGYALTPISTTGINVVGVYKRQNTFAITESNGSLCDGEFEAIIIIINNSKKIRSGTGCFCEFSVRLQKENENCAFEYE